MKTFEVELEYNENKRDEFGFPKFGARTMEIIAANEESVRVHCDKVFGRGNYNITSVEEISTSIKK